MFQTAAGTTTAHSEPSIHAVLKLALVLTSEITENTSTKLVRDEAARRNRR